MEDTVEKRRQARLKLKGYIADIADGHFIYGGIVEDISLGGLRLNDLPDKFAIEGKRYSVVLSGGPDAPCYKLKVLPRWRQKNGFLLDVGFSIAEAPENWKSFVQQIMPHTTKTYTEHFCVWDQFSGSYIS